MTWITSVTVFSMLVLPRGGYYFNATGMMACEPFYPRASIRILAACGFYFPTTMILMYCYGSAFHVNKLRLRKSGCNTITGPDDYGGASMEKVSLPYCLLLVACDLTHCEMDCDIYTFSVSDIAEVFLKKFRINVNHSYTLIYSIRHYEYLTLIGFFSKFLYKRKS